MQWLKKKLEMTLLAHLWIEKNYAGLFFQLPKMLHTSPVITLCFLYLRPNYFSSEMCSLLMFYIFCMDIGGYFFVSSLDRILEPELTGLQGFDRCSQIKCVVRNSRKKFFSSFLPTSLLVDVMVWWAAAPLTSSFAKPVQKCAERVILLFLFFWK